MRWLILIILVVAAVTIPAIWNSHEKTGDNPEAQTAEPIHTPDPAQYEVLKKNLAEARAKLSGQYRAARTQAEKKAVLAEARSTLESHLLKMTHCWRGTPWDFNGTCKTPGSGKIACGYFVSTVLRDAGVKCERVRLAQQASQNIIATFLPRRQMHIRAGLSYDEFLKQEIARGPGWRIVGLDRHVGFLVIEKNGTTRFIHSNPGTPSIVLDEPRERGQYLRASNYRVTGNITANTNFLTGWLGGKKWPTHTGR